MVSSVVVGSLRVDLGLNSAEFQRGAVRAQAQMRNLEVSTNRLQGAASGFNFRALNLQLSQVAQQTAATGQPMRALAVQAADIGLAFGPMGVVIGAVAGLVIPSLVTALGGGETAIETFANAAKETDSAMSELNSTLGSIPSLERDYRQALEEGNAVLAERIAKLIELRQKEAELQALTLPEKIREQAAAQRELQNAADDAFAAYEEAAAELARLEAISRDPRAITGGNFANELRAAQEEVQRLSQEYQSISTEAQAARNQTEQMRVQLDIANGVMSETVDRVRELVTGAGDTAAELVNAAIEAGRLNVALGSINMAGIIQQAGALAQRLAVAAAQALTLNANMGAGGPMGGARPTDAGRTSGSGTGGYTGPTPPARPDDIDFGYIPSTGGGSPGGGASAADQVDDLKRAFDNLMGSLDPAVRALNDLNRGLETADEALAAGAITAEQHAAAVALLRDEYADATTTTSDWVESLSRIGQGAVDDFVDQMVNGFEDGMQGVKNLLESTIKEMAAFLIKNQLQVQIGASATGGAGGIGGLGSLAAMGPVGIGAAAFSIGYLIGDALFGGSSQPYEGSEQQRIDQERAALVREMHELMGHEAYLKRQEIANLDESNRELGKRVQQLEEEAIAAAEAAAAAQRIADERMALQVQLWQLEGDEAALRDYQLSQLDESNRALQEQIWAQQDLAEATAETTRAIEEAVAAISPSDYSTQFAYDQAIALAKAGYLPTTDASIAEVNAAASQQSSESASLSKQISTLTQYMKQMLDLQYDWDTNGLLTVSA